MVIRAKLIICLFFIFFFGANTVAQNKDSLLKIAKRANLDTLTVKALNALTVIYLEEADYKMAIAYAEQAKKSAQILKYKQGLFRGLLDLSTAYENQGDYPDAQKYCFQALTIAEELNNKVLLFRVYNELGNINFEARNTDKALYFYNQGVKIGSLLNDKIIIMKSYIGLGGVYDELINDAAQALKYYHKSLKLAQEINRKDDEAIVLNNIGTVYLKSNINNALTYLIKSAEIHKKLGNTYNEAVSYVNIADVYSRQKNYNKAAEYLNKSMALGQQAGAKEIVQEVYRLRYLLDSLRENYASTFKNYKLYKLYGDSIENAESQKRLLQDQMQYEFDKKEAIAKEEQEKKDAIAAAETRRQKIVLISVSCFLVLMALLAVVIFRSLRINQRKNKIITEQKQEVEKQKYLVEEKHKEITDSINYAERIQRAMLASKKLLDANLKDYFVFYKPKDVVSGDFYWASQLPNNKFVLATADSTGHGVPGAIMSMLNMNSLKETVNKGIFQPAEILNHTRQIIISTLANDGSAEGGKDGMDCSLCLFDFTNMNLYVSAANNPVWIMRRDGEVLEIKPDKMPIGKHDKQNIPFTQHEIKLQKGDVIFTLTDGFPDQFGGEKNKKFMSKNLRELLAANAHLSMKEQKLLIEKRFTDWVGANEQIDDVTLIGIRV